MTSATARSTAHSGAHAVGHTHVGIRRLLQVMWIVGRHGWFLAIARGSRRWPRLVRFGASSPEPGERSRMSSPDRLRLMFEELGGTFVKFGQMLALQPDILPVAYCNALFKLLDRVDPFPYSEVDRVVREELGRAPEDIFVEVDREPLATASVGQVHVAWLADSSAPALSGARKVALKVQRPSVEAEFWADIRLMMAGMRVIEVLRLGALEWMLEPMREFIAWTREELDYRFEARYSETLRRRLAERPRHSERQKLPRIVETLTTRRVLVAEFLDGVTLLEDLRARERGDQHFGRRLEAHGFDRQRVAANVVDNFLTNAFEHGIYHADLHPANLMILDDSVVGYIDFGITGLLDHGARHHLMRMTLALVGGDLDAFQREFLQVTRWHEDSDLEGFRRGLGRLAEHWYSTSADGQRLLSANFTQVMTEMLHLCRRTDVMPERNVIKYIRSSIAIDGLVLRFAPGFDLSAHLSTQCSKFEALYERSQLFDSRRLLDSSEASAELLINGLPRASRVLDAALAGAQRDAADEMAPSPVAWQTVARGASGGMRRASAAPNSVGITLALIAGTMLVLTAPADAWASLGTRFDLLAAELAFVAATLAVLVWTSLRPVSGARVKTTIRRAERTGRSSSVKVTRADRGPWSALGRDANPRAGEAR